MTATPTSPAFSSHAASPFAGGTLADPVTTPPRPQQVLRFTQFQDATALLGGNALDGPVTVAHALPGLRQPVRAKMRVGLATHLRQTWQLQRVEIGDLVSHQSLAPGETIDLTVERTERRSLDQTREDMTQLDQSTESGSTDRESLNVAQTAARSNQWNVNGSLDFSIPGSELLGFGGSISAGYAGQSSDTLVTTSEHAHEQTRKAATALRTQTKLTVKVTSETTSRTVSRRTIVNPSSEHTLQIWGYELVKRFRVVTAPDRVQAAVSIQIQPLEFDSAFLAANAGFVRGALFDTDLLKSVDEAVAAARKFGSLGGAGKPVDEAEVNLLEGLLKTGAFGGGEVAPWTNQAAAAFMAPKIKGLAESYNKMVDAGLGRVMARWIAVYRLSEAIEKSKDAELVWKANRLELMRSLAGAIKAEFDAVKMKEYLYANEWDDPVGLSRADLGKLLVQFAWLADVLLGPTAQEEGAYDTESRGGMQALLDHLNDYAQHYTARYLEWTERTTGRAAFARLATAMLEQITDANKVQGQNPFGQFRVDDLRIVGSDLVVPIVASPSLYAGWTNQGDTLTKAIVQSLLAADGLAADLAAVHTAVDAALSKKVAEPVDVAEGAWQGDMAKLLQDAQAQDPTMGPALGDQATQEAVQGNGAGGTTAALSKLALTKPIAKDPPKPTSTPATPLLKPEFYVHVDDDVRTLVDGLHLVAGFV
jgi:hypothetical protein